MDFRALMRAGASDNDIVEAIRLAIDLKPERHEFIEAPQKLVRFMNMTGG
jgi:cyclic pyranopterin phosphate synthase